MFDGLNMKNLGSMMQNMQGMQEKFGKIQEEMKNITATGIGGLDDVTITINGDYQVVEVIINPDMLEQKDATVLQDYTKAAMNKAMQQIKEKKEEKTSALLGGLPLPAGFKLPF